MMDIKSKVEIKDVLVESSKIVRNYGHRLEEIQGKIQSNKDIEEYIEIKEEPIDMKEEYTENNQSNEQIFVLDGSQILNSDMKHEDNSLKGKYSSRIGPQTSNLLEKKELNGICCTSCNVNFQNDDELKSHLKLHRKKKLGCPYCNYECDFKSRLERHVMIHSGGKLFKCFECNYECIEKGNLKRHMLTHENRKLFKCSECDHECNEKGNLKQHMLTHANFRLFKCSECNYECKQKRYLRHHMLTHSNFKLFKCSECSYESNNKGNLKSHVLTTHTDFKLFKCSECSYEGNIERSFKRHLSVHAKRKNKNRKKIGLEGNVNDLNSCENSRNG